MWSSTNDHWDTTSAVSPSEHWQKSPAFIQDKLVACGEDGLTSLYCRRRARKRQREGTGDAKYGVSRCILHKEEHRGAHGLHHILEVKTSLQLGGRLYFKLKLTEASSYRSAKAWTQKRGDFRCM